MISLIIPATQVVVWDENPRVTEDLAPITIRDLATIVIDVVRCLH